ncbi:histone H1-like [Heptranchias perlo]|uniref:histone H1-like n=1 Tax=Heptranchias perlo TaxID=212740 RepID=UPI00355A21EE
MVSRPATGTAAAAAAQQQQQQQQQRRRRKRKKKKRQRRPYRRQRKKGPRINDLILQALSARKQRGGLSLASLRGALLANGYDVEKNKTQLRTAVRGLVRNGSLVQTKGKGRGAAGGYLKLSKRQKQKNNNNKAAIKPRAGVKAKKETAKKKGRTKNPPKKRTEKKATPRKTQTKSKKK